MLRHRLHLPRLHLPRLHLPRLSFPLHRLSFLLHRLLVVGSVVLLLALFFLNVAVLFSKSGRSILYHAWLPRAGLAQRQQIVGDHVWLESNERTLWVEIQDQHPIRGLMAQADASWLRYTQGRSLTFKATVDKYRRDYGRHPPPGFKEWYKFARRRRVYNIDDFAQIHDDLRPFWGLEPAAIRFYAAHASDDDGHELSTINIRDGQMSEKTWGWRSETFLKLLSGFAAHLPDMDIPMNRMDQPRVVVTWEEIQRYLKIEELTRSLPEEGVIDGFTKGMDGFFVPPTTDSSGLVPPPEQQPDYGWIPYACQPYMNLAAQACPPDSYARNSNSTQHRQEAWRSYRTPADAGGFVSNFNLSSDLCTVGPAVQDLHGLLFASTSMLATQALVPVFGECKTSVNNDILFPANIYWARDERYQYDAAQVVAWEDKDDTLLWRGATSGGTGVAEEPERWSRMHRQRLVQLLNSTLHHSTSDKPILALNPHPSAPPLSYTASNFSPAAFAAAHTDVAFSEPIACVPDCSFYDTVFSFAAPSSFAATFRAKYLIDVDGHSFSGRWRAFLFSRSLGIKATLFREWHDSRLHAWRHFAPITTLYTELYSVLAYFIGLDEPRVPRHYAEGERLAMQGREWAQRVLRREDMEVYTFRLLLEYGRLIDEGRQGLGVLGDGGEEMRMFDREVGAVE